MKKNTSAKIMPEEYVQYTEIRALIIDSLHYTLIICLSTSVFIFLLSILSKD